jgi:chromosome segregation ATPase
MAGDTFEELEARILKAIELLKTSRKQKEALEKELAGARRLIAKLEGEVNQFRRDRALIEGKVASLLETLSDLTEESLA